MKTPGQICKEAWLHYISQPLQNYKEWDVGIPDPGFEMYDALIKAGYKGCKIEHPLNRLDYVSRTLARDSKKINGCWEIIATRTYPGITRHYVNIYALKEK